MENSRVSHCPLRFWSVHHRKFLAFRVVRFAFGAFTVARVSRLCMEDPVMEPKFIHGCGVAPGALISISAPACWLDAWL